MPIELLRQWADSAEVVIAADGAADRLLAAHFKPHQIVGDFDSASDAAVRSGALILRDFDQNRTDCDKLLALAQAGGHEAITLVSVEGDLPDHEIATIQSALKAGLRVRLAYRRGIAWIIREGSNVAVRTEAGARVSLLPLVSGVSASLAGVEWPLANAELDPRALSSISNRATGQDVEASVSRGSGFLFVEYPPEELPFW